MSLIVGTTATVYDAAHASVPLLKGRRLYLDSLLTVKEGYPALPATWPTVAGAYDTVSIRPLPADLLSGKLDKAILDFAYTAPAGAQLNAWHEAGNLYAYHSLDYINPATVTKVHQYMHKLLHDHYDHVTYGPILCMPPTSMPKWMPGGMDWYGLDIYDWPQFHKNKDASKPLDVNGLLKERLDGWKQIVQHQTGLKSPQLNICETNSTVRSARPIWLGALGNWLKANGGHRLLTFWTVSPWGVGPWVPSDTATIKVLSDLAA